MEPISNDTKSPPSWLLSALDDDIAEIGEPEEEGVQLGFV